MCRTIYQNLLSAVSYSLDRDARTESELRPQHQADSEWQSLSPVSRIVKYLESIKYLEQLSGDSVSVIWKLTAFTFFIWPVLAAPHTLHSTELQWGLRTMESPSWRTPCQSRNTSTDSQRWCGKKTKRWCGANKEKDEIIVLQLWYEPAYREEVIRKLLHDTPWINLVSDLHLVDAGHCHCLQACKREVKNSI